MLLNKLKLTYKAKKSPFLIDHLTEIMHKTSKTIAFWREDESNQQLLHLYKIERSLTFGRT